MVLLAAGILAGGTIAGGYAAASAAPATSTTTISACVVTKTGAVRIASTCKTGETRLSWNVTGQAGAAGATGPAGAAGASGPQGPSGLAAVKVIETAPQVFGVTPSNVVLGCPAGDIVLNAGWQRTDSDEPLNVITNIVRPDLNSWLFRASTLYGSAGVAFRMECAPGAVAP
jgi:hypothetical protein